MLETVLETSNLTKYYGNKIGCRNINISVKKGEIFGLLGPNGAGKSTFIKTIVGLIHKTSGEAYLLGKPIGNEDVRKKIGYLPENFKYQEWMTGVDLLSFHAALCKLDRKLTDTRIDDVLNEVKLKGSENYKISTYSKGMQQRIGIACALIADPDILFLDEPTSALDPIGRKEVRNIMLGLKKRGKSVLLNSHLLSEVEMICDSIAIIKRGSIIKQGKTNEILEGKLILEICADGLTQALLSHLKQYSDNISVTGNRLEMSIEDRNDINDIAHIIIENGGSLYELHPKRESLESLFISLIEGGEET